MDPERGTREPAPLNLSLLDAGERTSDLARWLEFLAEQDQSARVQVSMRSLDDLLDNPLDGVVLVDADSLQASDSGLLSRRVCRDGVRLWLFGEDPARAVVAKLVRQTEASWLSWPPDFDSLRALLETSKPARPPQAIRKLEERAAELARSHDEETEPHFELRPPRPRGSSFGLKPGELEEIEAILKGEAPTEPSQEIPFDMEDLFPDLAGEEAELEEDDDVEEEAMQGSFADEIDETPPAPEAAQPPVSLPTPTEGPTWFKDQIADLADHVQRLELGLARATEESVSVHGPFGEGSAIETTKLREISDEAARLGQFTRTLGFLAAPPARGGQLFDLRTLLEEQLRAHAAEADSPRFLIRIADVLPIRSDKTLLLQAFDALLYLARNCTPAGETLKVEASTTNSRGEPKIDVSIRFPRGPLGSLSTEAIQRPYGLRSVMPKLGPNALAAARGIFRGQGGWAELCEDGSLGLEWRVRLPRVDPAG